jgi:uncharacterized YigZ family protein
MAKDKNKGKQTVAEAPTAPKTYTTLAGVGEIEFIEKKSVFLGYACHVESEEQALEIIKSRRKQMPDATHHVYAYSMKGGILARYSDDGEPQGTSGMPTLESIRQSGADDALVIITRYFGGTLLGTGGLVHAYGTSAKEGLLKSEIITRCLCNIVSVTTDYSLSGKIQYKIASDNLILDDTVYDENVTFLVCCTPETTEKFINDITDITNGKANCEIKDSRYVNI